MKTKTETILAIMNVLAWLTFVGYIVKASAIIISAIVSINNPIGAKNLYMGLNLYELRQYDLVQYTGIVVLMVALELLKATTAIMVTRVLSGIKMKSPFTMPIALKLEKISYMIILIWAGAMLFNADIQWLSKQLPALQANQISGEFLLLAGVVFLFSQIFKKGVEIQSENELTI